MREIHKNIKQLFSPNDWLIEEKDFNQENNKNNETIFTVANGYLGVRGFFEEGFYGDPNQSDPTTMINGIYEYFDYNHIWARPGFPIKYHSITKQVNPCKIEIFVDNESVDLTKNIENYSRVLNMQNGVLQRKFDFFTSNGKKLTLTFERFASKTELHVLAFKIIISCETSANIKIVSKIDAQVDEGYTAKEEMASYQAIVYDNEFYKCENDILYSQLKTKRSNTQILCSIKDNLASFGTVQQAKDDLSVTRTCDFTISNETVEYERLVSYFTNNDGDMMLCSNQLFNDEKCEYSLLKQEHIKAWQKVWASSLVEIENKKIQQGVRYAIFMLNQSCPNDGLTNISANGLTGTGYSGHTFWDTEIFMFPMFLHTDPERAKNLLIYRYNILDKARERASQMDDQGALFSWNSINGEECGHVFEAATAQYHLNCDIFYAIQNYVNATGDFQFLKDFGGEILFEMSKCLAHRGNFIEHKDNKFCINVICGPDEYNPVVDNNLFTNLLTQKMLKYSYDLINNFKENDHELYQKLIKKCNLCQDELDLWKRAYENMYIPYNEKLNLYMQDDNFLYKDPIDLEKIPVNKLPLLTNLHPLNLWRYQVIKQADIVLLAILCKDYFTDEMKKRIFDFYEPKTIHDSSLSAGVHSILAVQIGYKDEAIGYYNQSSRMDLDNVNRNTLHGIHSACMGSTWLTLTMGYAGMFVSENGIKFQPIYDKALGKYSFTITYKNSVIKVCVDSNSVKYILENGSDVEISHYDNKFILKTEKEFLI